MPAEDDAREPRSCGRCGWLMLYARAVAAIVARYTKHTERHVLECVMRVVGHLCATGVAKR